MSDIDFNKFKNKIRTATLATIGIFAVIFYLMWVILNRLQLGDITVHVFILFFLLLLIRPRQAVPVPVNLKEHLFRREEGPEVA